MLVDEGLADVNPRADNAPLKGLSMNPEGRKAVRRNFRRQTPAISVHTGDKISVESSGPNTAIAAGRGASVTQNINSPEVERLFQEIIREVEQRRDLPEEKKQEIRDVVDLAQAETQQEGKINEKRLTVYFQHLAMIAPDILEVAIAAATTPIAGPLPVILLIAKKVSERAKANASNKGAG